MKVARDALCEVTQAVARALLTLFGPEVQPAVVEGLEAPLRQVTRLRSGRLETVLLEAVAAALQGCLGARNSLAGLTSLTAKEQQPSPTAATARPAC